MFTLDSLKTHPFKDVDIPKPRELYSRFGMKAKKDGNYSGDTTISMNKTKVEKAAEADREMFEREMFEQYKK